MMVEEATVENTLRHLKNSNQIQRKISRLRWMSSSWMSTVFYMELWAILNPKQNTARLEFNTLTSATESLCIQSNSDALNPSSVKANAQFNPQSK